MTQREYTVREAADWHFALLNGISANEHTAALQTLQVLMRGRIAARLHRFGYQLTVVPGRYGPEFFVHRGLGGHCTHLLDLEELVDHLEDLTRKLKGSAFDDERA